MIHLPNDIIITCNFKEISTIDIQSEERPEIFGILLDIVNIKIKNIQSEENSYIYCTNGIIMDEKGKLHEINIKDITINARHIIIMSNNNN